MELPSRDRRAEHANHSYLTGRDRDVTGARKQSGLEIAGSLLLAHGSVKAEEKKEVSAGFRSGDVSVGRGQGTWGLFHGADESEIQSGMIGNDKPQRRLCSFARKPSPTCCRP